MQKLPKFALVVAGVLISLCYMPLRNAAKAWQAENNDGSAASAPTTVLDPDPVPSPEAVELMRSARDRLSQYQSVRASIVERADLGDRRFIARGKFTSGEFPRTRLEYEVRVGDTKGSLLEVCNGQVLHIQRTIATVDEDEEKAKKETNSDAEGESVSKPVIEVVRRDVQQILRAAPGAQNLSLPMHAADLGLGGLSAVLASLERSMIFESVKDDEQQGQSFKVLQGRWNPEYRNDLMNKLGSAAQQLAIFLPDRVRVDLDAKTLFPVRIVYLKRTSQEGETFRPMVSLEFQDVEFDVELSEDVFLYQAPPGIEPVNDTENFVRLLQGPPPASPEGATVPPGGLIR